MYKFIRKYEYTILLQSNMAERMKGSIFHKTEILFLFGYIIINNLKRVAILNFNHWKNYLNNLSKI